MGNELEYLRQKVAELEKRLDESEKGRRQKEARVLRESEEKYRILVEKSLQGLAIIQDGRLVFCNSTYARMAGYTVEELLSMSPDELGRMIHPDDRNIAWNRYQARLAGKPVEPRYEYRGIKKDGTEFSLEIYGSTTEYNGKPATQLAFLDISERKRAEAAAIESGERLKLALEAAGMASWDLNNQTGEVMDDAGWLPSLGYKSGEIEPNLQSLNALIHADDLQEIERAASDHLRGKTEYYSVEYRLRNKSGSWAWVLDRGKLVSRDSSGKPLRTMGVHLDITEHKHVMEQIRTLANEQRTILNTISTGICYLKHRKLQWLNPAFANMFGYEIGELWGMDTFIFYSNLEEYKRIEAEGYDRLAEGLIYSTEVLMKKKDGSPLWCSIEGQAINQQNEVEGSIWILHDITERRRIEEALRASEERFKRLVQNSNDIITVLDEKGIQTSVSGPIERILGYRSGELVGTSGFGLMHPDDLESAMNAFSEVTMYPGTAKRLEFRYRHKNGTWVVLEAVGTNLLADPVVNGIVMNSRDISERKKLQEQLQQAMKMEAVGLLAGGIAHDFNNLLNVINGYCELVLEDIAADDPKRKDLEQITQAGLRAASLTSQLLAFGRKQILQPEILDLNSVINGMSSMLRRLIRENIELIPITQPGLGLINADPGQIQQIIMNLAVNSRDAILEGGNLTIETANVNFDEEYAREHPAIEVGPYVMLAISDNGLGMDAVTKSHLFEPFFTTKEKGKGTGLGLSTVYGIVKQSNGFIWVYSEPGKGTTFKIYFPRAEGKVPRIIQEGKTVQEDRGSETILVTEDESSVRALVARILRERGYTVLEASKGKEALDIAEKYSGEINLLITDVVMPGMGGKALESQLTAIRPSLKALFISGYTDNAIVHHGILDSDVVFLQKPFTVESLTRKVRAVLDS